MGEFQFRECNDIVSDEANPLFRQAKIALKAKSEEQLLELEAIAKSLNLCARSIEDMYVIV